MHVIGRAGGFFVDAQESYVNQCLYTPSYILSQTISLSHAFPLVSSELHAHHIHHALRGPQKIVRRASFLLCRAPYTVRK